MPDGNPARLVYGTILTASLLAVESTRNETLLEAAGSVVLGVVILWLAHTYAAALGDRVHRPAPWSLRHLWETAKDEARLLQGAVVPLAALAVASAFGASTATAVFVALLAAVGVLVVVEVAAGLSSHLGLGALLAQVAISVVLGVGVLALKIVVH